MATEMTFEDYCCKHSLFTMAERIEFQKREREFVCNRNYHGMLVKFWQDKRELFLRRIMEREQA